MPVQQKRILVAGATGKMGQEVIRFLATIPDYKIVGALAKDHIGEDSGVIAGLQPNKISISGSIEDSLSANPDILIDFTRQEAALSHIKAAVHNKVPCIVGTTGFIQDDFKTIKQWAKANNTPVFIAPNFSLGAVLMMRFAQEAAKYFSWAEIIELHHEKKVDAPSGTALRTASLMQESRPKFNSPPKETTNFPSRGLNNNGIHIHSVRLPGLLAHQEVLLGNTGEVLTIRHDSTSRESFMAGIKLAIEKIDSLHGLVIGLESLL